MPPLFQVPAARHPIIQSGENTPTTLSGTWAIRSRVIRNQAIRNRAILPYNRPTRGQRPKTPRRLSLRPGKAIRMTDVNMLSHPHQARPPSRFTSVLLSTYRPAQLIRKIRDWQKGQSRAIHRHISLEKPLPRPNDVEMPSGRNES